MKHFVLEPAGDRKILSDSLRAIRTKRGKSARDIARSMGMKQRSYQRFEAGEGKLSYQHILTFAKMIDCDPFALLFGFILQIPNLAIDCADNKFCLIQMIAFFQFSWDRGSDIGILEPPAVIGGHERLYKDFGAKIDESERVWDNFLAGHHGQIGLAALLERFRRRWGNSTPPTD